MPRANWPAHRRAHHFALLCALVNAGCLGDATPGGPIVRDSAGVEIIQAGSIDDLPLCRWIDPAPGAVIGSSDGSAAGEPPLANVGGAALLADTLVVLDAGNGFLSWYDAAGRFQRRVGGIGRGPGEFLRPSWLGRSGDTLYVWDGPQGRITSFDRTGSLLSTVRAPGAGPQLSIVGRFADGTYLSMPGPVVFLPATNAPIRLPETAGRVDLARSTVNTLTTGRSLLLAVGSSGRYSVPFSNEFVAAAHGRYLVSGDNGVPALVYRDLDGRGKRLVRWLPRHRAVTAEARRAYAEYYAKEDVRLKPPDEAIYADELPEFADFAGDEAGWLWVRDYIGPWESETSWVVIDPRGIPRCRERLDARVRPLDIGERALIGLTTDPDGRELVVRYRLTRSQ